ncbi:MAG: peroxidase [Candidatus Solibacter usitatus]|nr:peroxidase [Candidatus Solibacter usitatus]
MFLREVEELPGREGTYPRLIAAAQRRGVEVPGIWHLFAFRPDMAEHLERMTHALMRGPSPLSPGLREVIAAYTSALNHCPF